MTTHTLNPDCDSCFACAICGKAFCAENEVVLCICTEDPTCSDCCDEHHGRVA